jgi:hypothetical protein
MLFSATGWSLITKGKHRWHFPIRKNERKPIIFQALSKPGRWHQQWQHHRHSVWKATL